MPHLADSSPGFLVPLLLFAAVAVVLFAVSTWWERKRRRALEAFAAARGFTFVADAPGGLPATYARLEPFDRGRSRLAWNLVSGRTAAGGPAGGEIHWQMFDYRYTTGSGKNKKTHRFGVVAARLPGVAALPRIAIRPEGVLDRIAGFVGFDDIDFESEAFSRRYHVKSEDRRRVFDLIHPRMMDYLMGLPDFHWQLWGPFVVITRSGRYGADELPPVMEAIEGFARLIPDYVRQDLGGGTPRATPTQRP